MFKQVWKKISEKGTWEAFDWVIKLDADAVFVPWKDNLESCSKSIEWASMKATKWGPIGEDLFAQKCMDSKGVSKIQNFDLTVDGVCPEVKKKWGGNPKSSKALKVDCSHVTAPVMH